MGTTVFSSGTTSEKVVNGESKELTPIALDDGLQMGIGLIQKDGSGQVWGLAHPKKLIGSWRGMKLAEQIKEIDSGSLCECWYAGQSDPHPSDMDKVKKVEAKIGRKARREILDQVPKDIDDILTLLKERDVNFAGWEIEEEVEKGVLPKSPVVEECLDSYHSKKEQLEAEKYGLIVPADQALRAISEDQLSQEMRRTAGIFVDSFLKHVDRENLVGIKHGDFGLIEHYVIGKLKSDPTVEATLKFSLCDTLIMGFSATIKIGLQRDGSDIEFQPERPEIPRPTLLQQISENGIVKKIGLSSALKRMAQTHSKLPSLEEKFPMVNRDHGAAISPAGKINNPAINVEAVDSSLTDKAEEIAEDLRNSLRILSKTQQSESHSVDSDL